MPTRTRFPPAGRRDNTGHNGPARLPGDERPFRTGHKRSSSPRRVSSEHSAGHEPLRNGRELFGSAAARSDGAARRWGRRSLPGTGRWGFLPGKRPASGRGPPRPGSVRTVGSAVRPERADRREQEPAEFAWFGSASPILLCTSRHNRSQIVNQSRGEMFPFSIAQQRSPILFARPVTFVTSTSRVTELEIMDRSRSDIR
jgi:hypothetical protein